MKQRQTYRTTSVHLSKETHELLAITVEALDCRMSDVLRMGIEAIASASLGFEVVDAVKIKHTTDGKREKRIAEIQSKYTSKVDPKS